MNMDGQAAPKKQITFGKMSFDRPSKRCIYAIGAVCFLCILCIVLATTLSRKPKDYCPEGLHCDWRAVPPAKYTQDERCEASCVTKPCLRSASFALSRIDSSKDPCNDFYEFSCGMFEKETSLFPDMNDAVLTYHEMENEMLLDLKEIIESIPEMPAARLTGPTMLAWKFYDDCLKTDRHADVSDGSAIGHLVGDDGIVSWPLLNDSIHNDDNQLTRIMSTSILYDVNPFFSLNHVGEFGEKGDERHKLIFHFGEVNIEQLKNIPTESSEKQGNDDLYLRYTSIIDRILRESGVSSSEISTVSKEIRRFEKEFKEEALKAVKEADLEKVRGYEDSPRFLKYDCRGLEFLMKSLQWCKVVENLLEDMGRPKDIKVEMRFIGTTDYYEAINKILSLEHREVIINYVVVKFIMGHLKYMPSPLRQMYYHNPELFPPDNTLRPLASRWQQCVDLVSSVFWFPLEIEYIKEKLPESSMKMADFFLRKMRDAYASVINRVPWIDAATKKDQIREIDDPLKLIIGNGIIWETGEAESMAEDLNKITHHEGTSILNAPQATLIEDILSLKLATRKRSYGSISFNYITITRPFKTDSVKIMNIFRLYYGNLRFPMFLHGRPMYIEFATLGKNIIVGLSQSFIHHQLPKISNRLLNSHLKCITDQMKTNGTTTTASKEEEEERVYLNFHNVLATLASTEAYLKYLKENGEEKSLPGLPFSNEQLFFIFLAQMNCEKISGERYQFYPVEHSTTPRERVNIPLSNSKAFSEAFRCSSGSRMNPSKKCCIHADEKSPENCK